MPEVGGQQAVGLRPELRQFARCGKTDTHAAAELDRRTTGRDPDQRRDRAVLVTFAEQRSLELRIGALVRAVVPVEAAAHLRGADQQRQQHAAEERLVLVGSRAGVCAREDRSRGLATELVHCELGVGPSSERVRARFDERFDEGPVLVERRPVVGAVLFEGERQVGAALQFGEQRTERAEAESPETVEELRSAHDHNCAYAVFGSSPF